MASDTQHVGQDQVVHVCGVWGLPAWSTQLVLCKERAAQAGIEAVARHRGLLEAAGALVTASARLLMGEGEGVCSGGRGLHHGCRHSHHRVSKVADGGG